MPTGKVAFWNLQRAGISSDIAKLKRAQALAKDAQLTIFAEVMQKCPVFEAEAFVYGSVTSHSLCYAALNPDGEALPMVAVDVEVAPAFASQIKGGKDPSEHFNRKMVEVVHGYDNWPRVFAIHANAAKGEKVATICAMWLSEMVTGNWVLIGDLNVEPEALTKWLTHFEVKASLAYSREATHSSVRASSSSSSSSVTSELGTFTVSEKVLDYVIHSDGMKSEVVRLRRGISDHEAILLTWFTGSSQ